MPSLLILRHSMLNCCEIHGAREGSRNQYGMIEITGGESQTSLQIRRLEIRHLVKDLSGRQPGRKEIEDVAHPNAHSSDTRASAALLRIHRDSIGNLVHGEILRHRLPKNRVVRRGAFLIGPAGGVVAREEN